MTKPAGNGYQPTRGLRKEQLMSIIHGAGDHLMTAGNCAPKSNQTGNRATLRPLDELRAATIPAMLDAARATVRRAT